MAIYKLRGFIKEKEFFQGKSDFSFIKHQTLFSNGEQYPKSLGYCSHYYYFVAAIFALICSTAVSSAAFGVCLSSYNSLKRFCHWIPNLTHFWNVWHWNCILRLLSYCLRTFIIFNDRIIN